MAAEGVILKNLEITLGNEKNIAEPFISIGKLEKLEKALGNVRGAVAALEGDDNEIRSGLGTLVALLHQVDDLLDEILSRRTRLSREAADQDGNLGGNLGRAFQRVVNSSNRVAQKVSLLFPSSNPAASPSPIATQFDELYQKLRKMGKHLKEKYSCPVDPRESQIIKSYALTKYKVIGRDDDRMKIIEMLLEQRDDETCVSVIPIIGSSGLGKSALAQFVFDDEEVKSHFDLRMWIQVSGISEERDIIREIAESCIIRRSNYRRNPKPAKFLHSHVHQNGFNFDILGCRSFHSSGTTPNHRASKIESDTYERRLLKESERRLKKEIEGKLYLLVLDDACITHGQHLKDLLAAGARGSRILLTSHLTGVADFAKPGIVKPHTLEILPQESSWELFDTFASKDPELQQIGKTIAGNCGGVPLTVKVAASYLCGKSKEQWLSFNEELLTRQEQQIMQYVLHTSYNDLPTRLKACFVYCSLFPNDFYFNKHDLISLWIAQGFIYTEHGQSLEDAAEKYFMELSRRCFFEGVITDDLGNIVTCKMHHKMSNLARQHAAGVMRIMTDSGVNLDSTCKHLSFTWDRDSLEKISSSAQVQHLRTLISVKVPDPNTKIDSLEMISRFKRLRVLDLHDLGIEELPVSIGKLIHLRFLDVSQNDGLVTLPKSITELSNLQTLKVNSCTKLNKIPGNFGELVHLKRFEVDECDSLTCMPKGLEKLTQLETLSRFVVSQDCPKDMSNIRLKALKDLRNLRGRLAIELLGDWTINTLEAQAELQNKSELVELKIYWSKTALDVEKSSYLPSEEEKLSYKKLLEQLQPTSNLKILSIEGYKGGDFPIWAGINQLATSLPYLVAVSIDGCDQCEHLPPFGKLRYLKRLTLRHMANVKYMERESSLKSSAGSSEEGAPASSPFYQSQKDLMEGRSLFFDSLEELTLHNFYNLENWWGDKVIVTPNEAFPSFRHLSKLKLLNCPNLRSMPLFTKVSDLDLHNVNQMLLENFAQKVSMGSNSSIKYLKIRGCPNLKSFKTVREGLGSLPWLQKLMIEKCHALSSLTAELSYLTSLKSLEISSCKELDLSEDGNDEEISNISSTPWISLNHLHHLTLRELPKMKCLPEGLKRIRNLRSLGISACTALKELPQWIGGLTMLQHLRIESCQAVTRLPDGLEEVKSLLKVEIIECPELMERCREHTGEDWHKIRHAQVLLHKSWRYGLMSELGTSKSSSNVRGLTDVKYIIVPVI